MTVNLSSWTAVILAAGEGTRMRSSRPKVLHPLAGRPMLHYVVDAARVAGITKIVVVVGPEADEVRTALPIHTVVAGQTHVGFVDQRSRLQRMPHALVAHVVPRQPPQLVKNERDQLLGGALVALLDALEKGGNFAVELGHGRAPLDSKGRI